MTLQWTWPVFETLHFVGLSLLIGTVGLFDLRMLGLGREVDVAALHRLVPFGVLGYFLNLATGVMFFSTYPDQYLFNPAFQTKLVIMAVAGCNLLIFYSTTFRLVKNNPGAATLPARAKMIALVSLLCWIGVIICGRLITFYRPPYFWCLWC